MLPTRDNPLALVAVASAEFLAPERGTMTRKNRALVTFACRLIYIVLAPVSGERAGGEGKQRQPAGMNNGVTGAPAHICARE